MLQLWKKSCPIIKSSPHSGIFSPLHFVLILVSFLNLLSCSIKKPATETPPPDVKGVQKSFFFDTVKGVDGKTELVPKDFACAWAPISKTGYLGEAYLAQFAPNVWHCNLRFKITQEALLGQQMNPSYPDDPTRWTTVISIPILKHYYYEKKKDGFGRETNEFEENSSRSDYSARTHMKLDFSRIRIENLTWDPTEYGIGLSSAEDIEWDFEKTFLGFTLLIQDRVEGSFFGARLRFNFIQFQHNTKFVKTPFNVRNAKKLNVLHIVGEKVEGIYPILSAAKWDLTKTHTVYLNGFPEEYKAIGVDVVEQWNDALADIGQPRAFRVQDGDHHKFAFDMRYPSITWVKDLRTGQGGLLGIAYGTSDLRNGEILWGQTVIYGENLLGFLKHYAPKSLPRTQAFQAPVFKALLDFPSALPYPQGLLDQSQYIQTQSQNILHELSEAQKQSYADLMRKLRVLNKDPDESRTDKLENSIEKTSIALAQEGLKDYDILSGSQTILTSFQNIHSKNLDEVKTYFSQKDYRTHFEPYYSESLKNLAAQLDNRVPKIPSRSDALMRHVLDLESHGPIQDLHRDFWDEAVGWSAAKEILGEKFDFKKALKTMIKELIHHEYGHFLGLGHNFKENILPDLKSIPARHFQKLETMAKKNMTNRSSVMGYPNPVTEAISQYEDIHPGPMDSLVLRYLYNREFPTYKTGERDFKYYPLPESGVIPNSAPGHSERKTSYFPHCNDIEASYGFNPYCNRSDRGYNAKTLIENYFETLNKSSVTNLFAFSDAKGGESPFWVRMMAMQYHTLNVLGRVRHFYDYMRQKYHKEIASFSHSEQDLYDFSSLCITPLEQIPSTSTFYTIFKNNPEFHELCSVNKYVVENMQQLLTTRGKDHSKVDWDNYDAPAGITAGDARPSYSRIYGTWQELSTLPIKIPSAFGLLGYTPWVGAGMMGVPRYIFSGENGKFLFSSLYPKETTQAVAKSIEENLFLNPDEGSISMGLTNLMIGNLLHYSSLSNEALKFPPRYIETIQAQSRFSFNYVALLLTGIRRQEDPNRIIKFTGKIYDLQNWQTTEIDDTYLLPDGKVIAKASEVFLYPLTRIRFLSNDTAFVIAYQIKYSSQYDDILRGQSIKPTLEKLNKSIIDNCVEGQVKGSSGNGLRQFFNDSTPAAKYPGFYVIPGIARDESGEKDRAFRESIKLNFEAYYKYDIFNYAGNPPDPKHCLNVIKNLGLVVTTAGILNGYWLPETIHYIVK